MAGAGRYSCCCRSCSSVFVEQAFCQQMLCLLTGGAGCSAGGVRAGQQLLEDFDYIARSRLCVQDPGVGCKCRQCAGCRLRPLQCAHSRHAFLLGYALWRAARACVVVMMVLKLKELRGGGC